MRDILPDIQNWFAQGKQVALATVVATWGSSPRRIGAKMAVGADGAVAGSVSGGCVENAVVEAALESLRTGQARLLRFSVADEMAWSVGLTCGGALEVFVQDLEEAPFRAIERALLADENIVQLTVIGGRPDLLGRTALIGANGVLSSSIGNEFKSRVFQLASRALERGRSGRLVVEGLDDVFMEVCLPSPSLVIVGGVHIAISLTAFAQKLGFHVIMIDPRPAWANEDRFPSVDRLIQAWPDDAFSQVSLSPSTAVVSLSHDPKIELPALRLALESEAFYVGALGSRTTDLKRRTQLAQAGATAQQLDRLHAPIGLEIGAESPEEIALAIMAEIVRCSRRADA